MDDTVKRPRIAVIAIHGVADQKPLETARTAADMLARAAASAATLGDQDRKTGTYQAFEEHALRIRVRPTGVTKDEARSSARPKAVKAMFGEALGYRLESQTIVHRLAENANLGDAPRKTGDKEKERIAADDDASLAYMAEQLSAYEVSAGDSIYETVRLESVRTGSKSDVDVHEMYWADLSRFAGNWLRWLIEFYQLLFFLCLVGRKSLGFARVAYEPEAKRPWRHAWPIFAWSQFLAEQVLALFIPVLNLFLLALALSVLPLLIPAGLIRPAVVAFVAVAAALAGSAMIFVWRTFFSPSGRQWPWWLLVPLAGAGAVAGLGFGKIGAAHLYAWLMDAWWPVPALTIGIAMAAFQKTRRGALPTAILVGAAVTGRYLIEITYSHGSAHLVMNALLRTAEWTLFGVGTSWFVLVLMALAMTVSGAAAVMSVAPGRDRETARRAAWTANVTLVLPTLLVLILNLTLWHALVSIAVPEDAPAASQSTAQVEKPGSSVAHLKESSLWSAPHTPLGASPSETISASKAVYGLVAKSQTSFFWLTWALFVLAALLLVWTIVPAVLAELRVGEKRNAPRNEQQVASSWLGENLSAGFRAMRVSGEIIRVTVVLVLPLGIWKAAAVAKWLGVEDLLARYNTFPLAIGGWLLLALIVSKGPFQWLALGLRSFLDVALDVINWLRLHPLDSNPRARICARFSSLLRHIEEWRSPGDGQGYRAIVILAHSQGTVITADLLRYLRHHGRSPGLPIYFFTMGCPLRQLYSLRFPHLYGWARHGGTTWPGREPEPSEIGVNMWVNAYRSGDYVGRYLWHGDDIAGPAGPVWSIQPPPLEDRSGTKREFCIGAGAHTHYWDETAPEIAIELDRLIGLAAH